ncbi:hypothetical protein N644_1387 [Lactiplantibacillus paraplantarum]|nr:hypothetical protein N644_1387 [Lactiplantibacillus paraplantarum]
MVNKRDLSRKHVLAMRKWRWRLNNGVKQAGEVVITALQVMINGPV